MVTAAWSFVSLWQPVSAMERGGNGGWDTSPGPGEEALVSADLAGEGGVFSPDDGDSLKGPSGTHPVMSVL